MRLKSLKDTQVEGKTILYRSPYDISVEDIGGMLEVKDDTRIKATLPTLKYLIEKGCKVVILTWVGRPDGKVVDELKTDPHARKLSELLGKPVDKVDDCVGDVVQKEISRLEPGAVLMLENVRFYPEEMMDDNNFAKELTKGCDSVVFDGFPQAHRKHASTTGILRYLPACAGFYLEEEVEMLSKLVEDPERPFTMMIGGAKISDKVDAINNLYDIADIILVGGGVANVFMKALGREMGDSFVEDVYVDKARSGKKDWIAMARKILRKKPKSKSFKFFKVSEKVDLKRVMVPVDFVIADSLKTPEKMELVSVSSRDVIVPNGWAALDIGPRSSKLYSEIISQSKTVFWNGPMGMFEDRRFAKGSKVLVDAVTSAEATTIVAGGDTIDLIDDYGDPSAIDHVSLAGGAALEFLAGKELPVLKALSV